ncbi:MAG: branched-chain amino acid transporter AzlD [Clostridiales bacterium]|nr:branched-chain amino acid transporter AzlD [Clostridiales bacterium]
MPLNPLQTLVMILAVAAGCALTRFLPFWLFPEKRKVPPVVRYLGGTLPPAMMGFLVVYCLKDMDLVASPHGLPEGIAIGCIVLIHTWKRNVLLSIGGGTAVFMVLTRILG